eukprot:3023266-Pyramimonas_sp.AAC.1
MRPPSKPLGRSWEPSDPYGAVGKASGGPFGRCSAIGGRLRPFRVQFGKYRKNRRAIVAVLGRLGDHSGHCEDSVGSISGHLDGLGKDLMISAGLARPNGLFWVAGGLGRLLTDIRQRSHENLENSPFRASRHGSGFLNGHVGFTSGRSNKGLTLCTFLVVPKRLPWGNGLEITTRRYFCFP